MKRNSFILPQLFSLIRLLALVTRVSTLGGDVVAVEDNKEIRQAWWEAYTGRKEPDQVYKRLERIQHVYASQQNISEMSWDDQQAKETYDILFEAWNSTPDKCNEGDFTWSDYFDRYFLIWPNIVNYWSHCEQKRIQVCEPVLEARLKAKVEDQIGEAKRQHLKLLVDSIGMDNWYATNEPTTEKREKALATGTLKYMETLESRLNNKSVLKLWVESEGRFKAAYKRLVIDLCSMVLDSSCNKQLEIFETIKRYNAAWEPTGLIKQWMEAKGICKNLVVVPFEQFAFKLLRKTNRGF